MREGAAAAPLEQNEERFDREDMASKIAAEREWLVKFLLNKTKNVAEAEDLAQDTMARALRFVQTNYDGAENIRPWLGRIAHNLFINKYRRVGLEERTSEDLAHTTTSEVEYSNDPILRRQIDKALGEINEEFRKAFLLFHAGKSYKQIAEELHIPVGTVMSRLFRANKLLREKLAGLPTDLEESTNE